MTTYGLTLAFDTDTPEFCRGFEAGMLWTQLQTTDERTFTLHQTNTELVMRMAEQLGLSYKAELLDDTWMLVHFEED